MVAEDEGSPTCPDCGSANLTEPDFEGFFDCLDCGAAWLAEEPPAAV